MIKLTQKGILHIVTAVVVVPLAAYASTWVPAHFPGLPHFNQAELTAFGVAGAGAALTAGLHYLERLPWFSKIVTVTDATGAVHAQILPNATVTHIVGDVPSSVGTVDATAAPPRPQPKPAPEGGQTFA